MKTASAPLTALINSGSFLDVTLYTITTTSGLTIRLADADFDVWDVAGNRYYSGAIGSGYPRIDTARSRATGHWKRGLDSDTWTVTIMPAVQDPMTGVLTYPDVAGGTPWLTACRIGIFDNASVLVTRAYFSAPPAAPFSEAGSTCVGTVIVFSGYVDSIDLTQTSSIFSVSDYKALLTITMPRNLYQPSCRNQLFDAGCGLSAGAYAGTGTAHAGCTPALIGATLPAPGGSGTWQLGRVKFTSGANAGFQRTISAWDGASTFSVTSPFPFPIALGDTFTIWPGCDKSLWTCKNFGNFVNFRGEPYIPVPEVSLGV